jgi:hypothetical protein
MFQHLSGASERATERSRWRAVDAKLSGVKATTGVIVTGLPPISHKSDGGCVIFFDCFRGCETTDQVLVTLLT